VRAGVKIHGDLDVGEVLRHVVSGIASYDDRLGGDGCALGDDLHARTGVPSPAHLAPRAGVVDGELAFFDALVPETRLQRRMLLDRRTSRGQHLAALFRQHEFGVDTLLFELAFGFCNDVGQREHRVVQFDAPALERTGHGDPPQNVRRTSVRSGNGRDSIPSAVRGSPSRSPAPRQRAIVRPALLRSPIQSAAAASIRPITRETGEQ
jgi:hypothetical protein